MIRKATMADFADVERLSRAFYGESGYEELYGAPIDDDSLVTFVSSFIKDPDKVVLYEPGKGMIAGLLWNWFFNRNVKVAQEMAWYVMPEDRRGSVGVRLYKSFEAWSKEMGAKVFVMGALAHLNTEKVQRFYELNDLVPVENFYGGRL